MQLGYVTLGETQGGGTWLWSTARGDMSQPPTAEVMTVTPANTEPSLVTEVGLSYRGMARHRRHDWVERLSTMAIIGGLSMVWISVVCLASLFVAFVVLPLVLGPLP